MMDPPAPKIVPFRFPKQVMFSTQATENLLLYNAFIIITCMLEI